ncbi:MAG: asparagine synthase (glutamine-hydrolyzing) [Deltaproteobacteria bacterium]|nr:asparagine synthase (glutamine-hydrolyzing) [Deltaproteobacteria bacterium]
MCGIAGIYAFGAQSPPVQSAELCAMSERMRPRGPDGEGSWISEDGRLGLAHRRLSIIDLSDRAAQPMRDPERGTLITFNGEIYNYRAIRDELESRGHRFRTTSDTEVLLKLYGAEGREMLTRLRGMFAFAIWDAERRELFLARDPLGIKPLYYAAQGGVFRFASQVKALMAGGAISRDVDPSARVGFFTFGSVPEPLTYFRAVRALPAGTCLTVGSEGPATPRSYYSLADAWDVDPDRPPEPADEAEVRAALLDSVRHHLVADVPVGAFLSAGIDSAALVGLMAESSRERIRTVTIGFSEFEGSALDEVPLASEVAEHYGVERRIRQISEQELEADLPRILDSMDQPSIDGINTWFVSKTAAEEGLKVAVSGLGGDELLGGYSNFHDIPRYLKLAGISRHLPGLGRGVRRLASALLPAAFGISPKAAGMLEYGGTIAGAYLLKRALFMPWELSEVLESDLLEAGLEDFDVLAHLDGLVPPGRAPIYACVAALEAGQYMRNQLLRDTDWASMAHSLEVRVPLVDHVLLRRLGPWLATRAASSSPKKPLAMAPRPPVPDALVTRPKTGFMTPLDRWLETSGQLGAWRRSAAMQRPSVHWARRFAWNLDREFAGTG